MKFSRFFTAVSGIRGTKIFKLIELQNFNLKNGKLKMNQCSSVTERKIAKYFEFLLEQIKKRELDRAITIFGFGFLYDT